MLPILLERIMVRNTEKKVAERIKQKHNGTLEYISGYKNKDSLVKVRCLVCGETFERTYHHLTTHPNACPVCKDREQRRKKQERERERTLSNQQKRAERFSRHQLIEMRVCAECGTLFIPKASHIVRCSTKCTRKAMNRGSDSRLNVNNVVDKDITLTKLYGRDNGICQLCGKPCEWEDRETRKDGTVVAGGTYPSIDHIIPLSEGGKHSWDNVRLAHRGCNTNFYWKYQRFTPPANFFEGRVL